MRRLGLVLAVLLAIPSIVSAYAEDPVCYTTAEKVKRHNPGMYPSWTSRMPNHKGEKCWFPVADRHHKKWTFEASNHRPSGETKHKNEAKVDSTPIKPRAVSTVPADFSPSYAVSSFEDRFSAVLDTGR